VKVTSGQFHRGFHFTNLSYLSFTPANLFFFVISVEILTKTEGVLMKKKAPNQNPTVLFC